MCVSRELGGLAHVVWWGWRKILGSSQKMWCEAGFRLISHPSLSALISSPSQWWWVPGCYTNEMGKSLRNSWHGVWQVLDVEQMFKWELEHFIKFRSNYLETEKASWWGKTHLLGFRSWVVYDGDKGLGPTLRGLQCHRTDKIYFTVNPGIKVVINLEEEERGAVGIFDKQASHFLGNKDHKNLLKLRPSTPKYVDDAVTQPDKEEGERTVQTVSLLSLLPRTWHWPWLCGADKLIL